MSSRVLAVRRVCRIVCRVSTESIDRIAGSNCKPASPNFTSSPTSMLASNPSRRPGCRPRSTPRSYPPRGYRNRREFRSCLYVPDAQRSATVNARSGTTIDWMGSLSRNTASSYWPSTHWQTVTCRSSGSTIQYSPISRAAYSVCL